MATKRIRSAIVQYVITESDAAGEPINEEVSQPIRVFRAVHGDIWTHGDAQAFPPPVVSPQRPKRPVSRT